MNINQVLTERFSPVIFTDKDVPDELIKDAVHTARWSPSSFNEQPWRVLVAKDKNGELYKDLFSTLSDSNKLWADSAPALLLIMANKTMDRNGQHNPHAVYDTGQFFAYLSMVFQSKGILNRQMAGFNKHEVIRLLELQDHLEPLVIAAVGYYDPSAEIPEHLLPKAKRLRTRLELDKILTFG
jgi:nitroreductase